MGSPAAVKLNDLPLHNPLAEFRNGICGLSGAVTEGKEERQTLFFYFGVELSDLDIGGHADIGISKLAEVFKMTLSLVGFQI